MRVTSAGPFSVPSTSAPFPAVSAPSAEVPSSDVPLVSGAVAAFDASPVPDVPPSTVISLSVLLPLTALALECEESDMEFVPAPVSDVPDPVTDEEMCFGDEEVICEDAVAAAAVAAATIAAADAPSSSRRSRRNRCSRVKYQVPPVPGVDRSSVDMDLSSEDDPDSSKLLRSFDEVWHDRLTWEKLCSTRHGRVLKKVGARILSVESTPVLLFGARFGVGSFPVSGVALDEVIACIRDDVWSPSPNRVHVPDLDDEFGQSFMDLGSLSNSVFERDARIDNLRFYWYEDNPDDRPVIWSPIPAGQLPPPLPDIPRSSFSVFVAWDSSE